MKIAIHHREGSFSERWIEYCKSKNIKVKVVNCYDSNIIDQLKDCDGLMWHHSHLDYKDLSFAKGLLFSLEQAGKKVFPNFNTAWHFDDKVGQKYLFEAINAPLVPSYVFYEKKKALTWAESTIYPKVFKLRGGAGAMNVSLVNSKEDAFQKINRAFGKGFSQFNRFEHLKERYRKYKNGKDSVIGVLKGIGRVFVPTILTKMVGREKGYVYFQEYIENDGYDIRVVVVGENAIALKRIIRENDFRASGSGNLIFENENIDKEFIRSSFRLSEKMKTQSAAFDFIKDLNSNIYVVEVSYGFPMLNFLDGASGYWTSDIKWHEGKFNPQAWMVDLLIKSLEEKN